MLRAQDDLLVLRYCLPQFMPASARQSTQTGLLSFWDSDAMANAVLASVSFADFILAMSGRPQPASGF